MVKWGSLAHTLIGRRLLFYLANSLSRMLLLDLQLDVPAIRLCCDKSFCLFKQNFGFSLSHVGEAWNVIIFQFDWHLIKETLPTIQLGGSRTQSDCVRLHVKTLLDFELGLFEE